MAALAVEEDAGGRRLRGGQASVTYDCNDGIKCIDSVGVVGDNSAHTADSGNGSYGSFSGLGS